MPEYPCLDCGRIFPAPSKLRKHQNGKKPCKEPTISCLKCDKKFTNKCARNTHQRSCPGKPKTAAQLEADREFARLAYGAVQAHGSQQLVQNIHQHIQQTNIGQLNLNINISNVGEESTSHIDMSLNGLESLLDIKNGRPESLLAFCKLLRCNPDVPGNHNIMVLDPEHPKVMARTNGKWTESETDKELMLALNSDATLLSDNIDDMDDLHNRPDLHDYKFGYLLHSVRTKCTNGDTAGLSGLLQPLKDMLHDLTKTLYLGQRDFGAGIGLPPAGGAIGGPITDLTGHIRLAELEVQKLLLQVQLKSS